ncbi:hypothetical protein [Nocardioides zeae]|uniref:Uncharacterized protein n=1 Tax=Nocardioides zeae TaxID=1457234 RepID=A0AAJ1U1X2_9ACTN|nr:hypothetical protein [Nocardioides zeae]MDQ1103968.1 hypothetical protein [Nocardioides zeae]
MSRPVLTSMARRLDLPVERLALLEAYDEADLTVLDDAISLAIRAEDRAVADGLEEAVRFVPRPLRGRARALVFGTDRG